VGDNEPQSVPSLDERRLQLERRQASFERRYRLLELRERQADRNLKLRELELNQGRGIRFTSGQATVAAAAFGLISALIGGLIQGILTRDVEAAKNRASVEIESLKAKGNLDLEAKKQEAAEKLDRARLKQH
jgi:hypothetical protein